MSRTWGEREECNEGVGGLRGELIFYHAHYLLFQTHLNQFISVLSLLWGLLII